MKVGSDDAPRLLGCIFRNYLPSILGLGVFLVFKGDLSFHSDFLFFFSHERVQVFKVKL